MSFKSERLHRDRAVGMSIFAGNEGEPLPGVDLLIETIKSDPANDPYNFVSGLAITSDVLFLYSEISMAKTKEVTYPKNPSLENIRQTLQQNQRVALVGEHIQTFSEAQHTYLHIAPAHPITDPLRLNFFTRNLFAESDLDTKTMHTYWGKVWEEGIDSPYVNYQKLPAIHYSDKTVESINDNGDTNIVVQVYPAADLAELALLYEQQRAGGYDANPSGDLRDMENLHGGVLTFALYDRWINRKNMKDHYFDDDGKARFDLKSQTRQHTEKLKMLRDLESEPTPAQLEIAHRLQQGQQLTARKIIEICVKHGYTQSAASRFAYSGLTSQEFAQITGIHVKQSENLSGRGYPFYSKDSTKAEKESQ